MVVIRPFGYLGYSPVRSQSVSLPGGQEVMPAGTRNPQLYLSTQAAQTASVYQAALSPVHIATSRSGTVASPTREMSPLIDSVRSPYIPGGRTYPGATGTDPGAPVAPADPMTVTEQLGPMDAYQGDAVATDLVTGTMSDADQYGATTSDLDSIFRRVPWWAWAAGAGVGLYLLLR